MSIAMAPRRKCQCALGDERADERVAAAEGRRERRQRALERGAGEVRLPAAEPRGREPRGAERGRDGGAARRDRRAARAAGLGVGDGVVVAAAARERRRVLGPARAADDVQPKRIRVPQG
jgi:hypothetical protein